MNIVDLMKLGDALYGTVTTVNDARRLELINKGYTASEARCIMGMELAISATLGTLAMEASKDAGTLGFYVGGEIGISTGNPALALVGAVVGAGGAALGTYIYTNAAIGQVSGPLAESAFDNYKKGITTIDLNIYNQNKEIVILEGSQCTATMQIPSATELPPQEIAKIVSAIIVNPTGFNQLNINDAINNMSAVRRLGQRALIFGFCFH